MIEYTGTIDSFLTNPSESRVPFLSSMFSETNYLEGEVVESNAGITTFKIGTDMIEILGDYTIGNRVGILLKPEDIILSRVPIRTSARNMIKAKIIKFVNHIPGVIDIHLKVDRLNMVSRITERAQQELQLQLGDDIFAIFKASSPQIVREE